MTQERAVLVDIVDPRTSEAESNLRLEELASLVKTYGGITVLKTYQKRSTPNYQTYIGSGKLANIMDEIGGTSNFDILILNNLLKSRQTYNLEEACFDYQVAKNKELERYEDPHRIKVWDRMDLILKIFDKHATTAEAKLQIELASIKHMGPRIFGMGMELSRQAGGIGTVGVGETNTEIMKRHLQRRTKLVEEKIKNYGEIQGRQRDSRRSKHLKTIALAGYTNAGKSTLIKALTKKKEVYIADALFATLDSKVGELYLPALRSKAMVADTIGFIQDLPPDLIRAFKTTLAEIVEADLILHVIDVNDKNIHHKIQVVEEILAELADGREQKKIYVFNKVDILDQVTEDKAWRDEYVNSLLAKYSEFNPQVISALEPDSLINLVVAIERSLQASPC